MMIQKHTIGFMQIQKNAQNVKQPLKRMAVAIMSFVVISHVDMNSVGFVQQHGHRMDQPFIIKKMKSLQEREGLDMSWVEVQFLRNAVDVLQKSRQILMFTHVFAFYLQKSNNTTIFEDNQANLEQATEKLSEYLEREMPETIEDISEIKCLVQDRAVLFRQIDKANRTCS